MKRKQYDNIISLGTNCEVSFRCANLYKDYSTFPFSWVQIYDLDKFILALDDLSGMYKGAYHLDKDLIVFEKYNIGFHLKNDNGEMMTSIDYTDSLTVSLKELDSRMNHLIDKWEKAKEQHNAFIQYITIDLPDLITKYVNRLFNQLSKHFSHFDLFIVVKKETYKRLMKTHDKSTYLKYVKKVPKREQINNPVYSDRIRWLMILNKIKRGNILRYLYSTYPFINRCFCALVYYKNKKR